MVSQPESQPLKTAGEAVARDERVDALLFMMGVYHHVGDQIAAEVKALFESSPVPVAFAWLTGPREQIQNLRKASVPVFGDYSRAIRGLESLLSLKNAREAAASRPRSIDHARSEAAKRIIRESTPSPDGFLPPEACAKRFSTSTASRDPRKRSRIRRKKRSRPGRNFRRPSPSRSYRRASRTRRKRAA